jgi:hypothetical protein
MDRSASGFEMKFDTPAKKFTAIVLSLVGIIVAGFFIFRHLHQPPPDYLQHHRALGRVMADEVAKSLENREKKRLVVITADAPNDILRAQTENFFAALKSHPEVELKETEKVESDGKRHLAAGTGLSTRKFVRIVEHNLKADAIVSFIGVPDTEDPEWKKLTVKVPRFLAETSDRERLPSLLSNRTLRVAIVPRFEFPAPVKEPKTEQEWFDKYFQIVRAPKNTNTTAAAKAD